MATIRPYLGVSKIEGYNKRRVNAYNRTHMRRYSLNVNKKKERAIIRWLEENKPYQNAIKRLICEEIKRKKKESVL